MKAERHDMLAGRTLASNLRIGTLISTYLLLNSSLVSSSCSAPPGHDCLRSCIRSCAHRRDVHLTNFSSRAEPAEQMGAWQLLQLPAPSHNLSYGFFVCGERVTADVHGVCWHCVHAA